MNFSDPAFSTADRSAIDITFPNGLRGTVTQSGAATAPIFNSAVRGDFGEVAPYAAPARSPAEIRFAMMQAADAQIATGYRGRQVSAYGYLAQLNALGPNRRPDQTADLRVLLAAADWEQKILDAKDEAIIAGMDPQDVQWPAPPEGLAALADLC